VFFGEDRPEVEDLLKPAIQKFFTTHGLPVNVTFASADLTSMVITEDRQQYPSGPFLDALDTLESGLKLGVVDGDLYSDSNPSLNFIFGEARVAKEAAVISTTRLFPEYYGFKPNQKLFLERIVKEALHELGHVAGLGHCQDTLCLMHFSNSIHDTDLKYARLCKKCDAEMKSRIAERF
jgi:archaemetzincin